MKYRQIVKTVAHACINYKLSLPIDFKLIMTRTSCMLYAKGENNATFKGRLILLNRDIDLSEYGAYDQIVYKAVENYLTKNQEAFFKFNTLVGTIEPEIE